jgi:hypothetical protein
MLRFVGGMVWFSRKHAPRNTSLRVFSSSQHHRHGVGKEKKTTLLLELDLSFFEKQTRLF